MSTYKSKWQLKGIVVGEEKPATKNSYHLSCLRRSGSILHIRGKSKGILLYKTEWELCQILYCLAGCLLMKQLRLSWCAKCVMDCRSECDVCV